MTKSFLILSLFAFVGCGSSSSPSSDDGLLNAAFTHVRGECPSLNGRYSNGNRVSEVSTSKDSRNEAVLTMGLTPLVLDALEHPMNGGVYVGVCQKKAAIIRLSQNGVEIGRLKIEELANGYRFTQRKAGGATEVETWTRSQVGSPSGPIVAEGRFTIEGEVDRQVEFSRARGSWQGCHSMEVEGTELYSVDLSTSQAGWMDKFELTIRGRDLAAFKNGSEVELTEGAVRFLVFDRNGTMYRARIGGYSRCKVVARRVGLQVSGSVSCVLSGDPMNSSRQQLTVNGVFQCKDGTIAERI